MDFGMFSEFHTREGMTQEAAFDESFALIDEAENLGIDSVWLGEHHFSPDFSVLASPMVLSGAIAARTNKIRIGLAVHVLPLTHPLRVAEEAATVDHLSKGRFEFGIGRSGITKYYHGYNIPYSDSRDRFFEALDVIMKAWNEDQFSHQGEFYSYQDVVMTPKPYQQPHPPIRIAVASEDTFATVGKMGHPIFISANMPVPLLQERLGIYRQARKAAGHSGPGDVAIRIPTYVAEDSERAISEPKASALFSINYGAQELVKTANTEETASRMRRTATLSYEEILKQRVMYGTPEAVVGRLHDLQETLGITGVVMEVNYGGQVPNDCLVRCIRLLAEKVIPAFK